MQALFIAEYTTKQGIQECSFTTLALIMGFVEILMQKIRSLVKGDIQILTLPMIIVNLTYFVNYVSFYNWYNCFSFYI